MAYKDFDQFYLEKKREPKLFKFQGEVHHLPPALPTAAMLLFKRWSKAGANAEVEPDDIIRLVQYIFGAKNFQKWTYTPAEGFQGLDMEQMMDLLSWASEAYGLASSTVVAADPNGPAAP